QNVTERVDLAMKAFLRRVKGGEKPGHAARVDIGNPCHSREESSLVPAVVCISIVTSMLQSTFWDWDDNPVSFQKPPLFRRGSRHRYYDIQAHYDTLGHNELLKHAKSDLPPYHVVATFARHP